MWEGVVGTTRCKTAKGTHFGWKTGKTRCVWGCITFPPVQNGGGKGGSVLGVTPLGSGSQHCVAGELRIPSHPRSLWGPSRTPFHPNDPTSTASTFRVRSSRGMVSMATHQKKERKIKRKGKKMTSAFLRLGLRLQFVCRRASGAWNPGGKSNGRKREGMGWKGGGSTAQPLCDMGPPPPVGMGTKGQEG